MMKLQAHVPAGSGELEKPRLTLGFIPLTDCAPLVIAREKGCFARHGLEVTLSKETSWANIRDKTALGLLDGAQMLASMPLAMTLGVGPQQKRVVTAFNLSLNGNAVTVSEALYRRMQEADPAGMSARPLTAIPLRAVIESGGARPRLATVFPVSTHNYELRYWLAAAGLHPDRDVQLTVLPPAQMVHALAAGQIDGFCVGEPYSSLAVRKGLGRVLVTSYEIWNNSPEKVFAVSEEWVVQHPLTHRALLMGLMEACRWLDAPEHREETVEIISRAAYVNAPRDAIRLPMFGAFQYSRTEFPRALPDFHVFHRHAANFPWRSHALWLLTQMLRWGQLASPVDLRAVAESVFRADLYREAASALSLPAPETDYKTEGTHAGPWFAAGVPMELGADRFHDGGAFDPAKPIGYLRGLSVHGCPPEVLEAFAAVNPPVTAITEGASPFNSRSLGDSA